MKRSTSNIFLATSLLASTVGAHGCAPDATTDAEPTGSESASLLSSYEQAAAIAVLDSGHWQSGYVYHGVWRESFWVDLSVRNEAYNKEVGILWSADGWATQHTALAHYKGSLGGNRERWGLDVSDFATAGWGQMPEVEYAAYVRQNGQTQWSVFRDHYIYDKVSVAHPVHLLRASLSMSASGAPVLEGAVRALNVPADRHVFVRYTTDGWKSSRDAEATYDGHDFQLSTPLQVDTTTAEQVEFALRLETAGEIAWDNNAGQNFARRLAPRLVSSGLQSDAVGPAGGVEVLSGQLQSDLPIAAVSVRIDGGAPMALSAPDFTPQGGVMVPFSTASLADGTHTLRFEVTGAGGFQRAFDGPSFKVKNALSALSSWRIPAMPEGGVSFDAELAPDGSYYVLGEHTVVRYPAIGADAPSLQFAPAPIDYILHDVTLDGQGRVYALGIDGTIMRWRADGTLDTTFGNAGALTFSGPVGSSAICNIAAIEATARALYVVDSCNSRILRMSLDGAPLGELNLSSAPSIYTLTTATFKRGDAVWVLRARVDNGVQSADLIEVDDAPGSALAALRTVALDPAASTTQAFAVTDDGFWVSTQNDNVVRLDTSGAPLGTWLGGGGDFAMPGALSLARRIEPLADGSVAVLSWGSGRVERLAPRAP